MKLSLLIILILLFPHLSFNQITSVITTNRDTISTGQEVTFYHKVSYPRGVDLKSLDYTQLDSLESLVEADSLPRPYYAEIEWIGKLENSTSKVLTVDPSWLVSSKNTIEFRDTFSGLFWDIGVYSIPHPKLIMAGDSTQQIIAESPMILVRPPAVVNTDSTQVILPIENIIREETTWRDYKFWIILIGSIWALIMSVIIYNFFIRKKKGNEDLYKKEEVIEPDILALQKLFDLKDKEYWLVGKEKLHQSELTYIIREYLENKFSVPALESTTSGIINSLKKYNFGQDLETDLSEILQIADLVKFAKAVPPEDINRSFIDKGIRFVERTKSFVFDSPEVIEDDDE